VHLKNKGNRLFRDALFFETQKKAKAVNKTASAFHYGFAGYAL
jgi:hypothetical protein